MYPEVSKSLLGASTSLRSLSGRLWPHGFELGGLPQRLPGSGGAEFGYLAPLSRGLHGKFGSTKRWPQVGAIVIFTGGGQQEYNTILSPSK